jgi:hypothetical protein
LLAAILRSGLSADKALKEAKKLINDKTMSLTIDHAAVPLAKRTKFIAKLQSRLERPLLHRNAITDNTIHNSLGEIRAEVAARDDNGAEVSVWCFFVDCCSKLLPFDSVSVSTSASIIDMSRESTRRT